MIGSRKKPAYLLIDNTLSSENEVPNKVRVNHALKNTDQETPKLPVLGKPRINERTEQSSQDYFQAKNKYYPEGRESRKRTQGDSSPSNADLKVKGRNTNRSMIMERERERANSYYKNDANKSFHVGKETNEFNSNVETTDPSSSIGKYDESFNQQTLKKKPTTVIRFPTLKGINYENKTETSKGSGWNRQHKAILENIQFSQVKTPHEIAKHKEAMKKIADKALDLENQVLCPYCQRNFNAVTAESHIPKCKFIINRPSPPKRVRIANDTPDMSPNNNNSQDEEIEEIHETKKNTRREEEMDPSPNSSHRENNFTEANNICNCRSRRRTNGILNTEQSGLCHCNNRMDSCDDSFYQQKSYRNSSYDQNRSHRSHHPTEGSRNRRDSLNLKDYQNLVLPITQLDASRRKNKESPLISDVYKSSQNRVVCKYCDGIFPAKTIQNHSELCRSLNS